MPTITPIAYARNGFADKFGIPRQSRPDSVLLTRIEFAPDYADPNMIRGIEGYSHLWLIWGFSEAATWSPTVRPPRLGGNTRMGVLATRSPFRPNHLGLTSVELLRVESGALVVRGADLLDGTPIYDIKPYLSFSDSHPEARNGFAEAPKDYRLQVVCDEGVSVASVPDPTWQAIIEVLSQDPRPAYQDDPTRVYKLDYDGWHVEFRVVAQILYVQSIGRG